MITKIFLDKLFTKCYNDDEPFPRMLYEWIRLFGEEDWAAHCLRWYVYD